MTRLLAALVALFCIAFPTRAAELYITSMGAGKVHKYDTDTARMTEFATGFSQPFDCEFGPDNVLYVTNFGNGKISKVSASGVVTDWVLTGERITQPVGICFSPTGDAFVATYNTNDPRGRGTVKKITPAGVVSTVVSGIVGVTEIIYSGGKLYSANYAGGSTSAVYEIDPVAKTFTTAVSYQSATWGAYGLAMSGSDLLVGMAGSIWRKPATGPLVSVAGPVVGIMGFIVRDGAIWGVDMSKGELFKFSPSLGSSGMVFTRLAGGMSSPTGITARP